VGCVKGDGLGALDKFAGKNAGRVATCN